MTNLDPPRAGVEPGERQLNGPQTTGRAYRNLSEPLHHITRENDLAIPMRDGVTLVADLQRPEGQGAFPALVAASPYPREIQDLGAPMGLIEAGASDFFVPRGYSHLIVNVRSTGDSGGTFGLLDRREWEDMYDVVEWVAAQSWCDGSVGMIGISYFAMTQVAAAAARPPHLKAIFPVAVSPDVYGAAYHNGLFSATFISSWLATLGVTAGRSEDLYRGKTVGALRRVLNTPRLHQRFAHMNGEAAMTVLKEVMRVHYDPEPWDRLWEEVVVDHQVRDAFWDERDTRPALAEIDIPTYLGCDWDNVPMHLSGTFEAWEALSGHAPVRLGMLPEFGLTWPWESLHVEALAWFDHWLKDAETGIMDGPPVRYWLPVADEWRTAEQWPPPEAHHVEYALRADGGLDVEEGESGSREYLVLGDGLARPKSANPPSAPDHLVWETASLAEQLDMVGEIELRLVAAATAPDTAWIVSLDDVDEQGTTRTVTAGWLRASLREVDEAASRPGAPRLPCSNRKAVPPHEDILYRIPLVPNARRFAIGHRLRLTLRSDDSSPEVPVIMSYRHAPVGGSSRQTIRTASRVLIPVLPS
jgi:uncharacterized protein